MTYGTIKVDTVTFTNDGVDKSVTLSGLVQNPTFSGNVTVTGTLSGVTVTGTTANFTSGNFTNISGGTHTITSGVFAAGSAASPSITFTGDLNTGIYSPGADQVAISTGGSGRLFVDASGRLGVGTSSPSDTLQINKTGAGGVKVVSTTQSTIYFSNAAGTGGYIIGRSIGSDNAHNLFSYDATNSHYVDYFEGGSGGYRSFYTNGTERLRITSAGLVGIGTSSPSYALQVAETSAVVSAASYSTFFGQGTRADLVLQATSSNNDQQRQVIRSNSDSLIFGTENAAVTTFTEKLRIDSLGRVGIGISSPGRNLHVAGSSATALIESTGSTNADLLIGDGGVRYYGIRGVAGGGSLQIRNDTANTTLATFTSTGLVGIGTTSPTTTLDCRGVISTNDAIYCYNTARDGLGIWYNPGGAGVNQLTARVAGGDRLTIDSSGRVGIGTTSPSERLHVSGGNSRFDGDYVSFGNNGYIRTDATGELRFQSGSNGTTFWNTGLSSEMARFDTSGRLLVGTSSNDSNALAVVQGYAGLASGQGVLALRLGTTRPTGADVGIGSIRFESTSNTSSNYHYASISAFSDGASSSDTDIPGRLVFSTTADGASYPTERLRITSAGLVGIGTSSPSATTKMSIVDSTSAGIYFLRTAQGETVIENTGPLTIRQSSGNGANQNIFFKTGASVGTEVTAMTIDGSQRVGIGTTSPGYALHVSGTGAVSSRTFATDATGDASFFVQNDGNGICGPLVYGSTKTAYGALASNETAFYSNRSTTIMADGGSTVIKFATGGNTERARIDSSGRLLVGTSSARANFYNDTNSARFQVEGADNDSAAIAVVQNFNANTLGGQLILAKSNLASVGSNTLVAAGDRCGTISFQGNDGTQFVEAALIRAEIDGTPGANDMPGRLVFSTTADGASSPTERMRIDSVGRLLFANTSFDDQNIGFLVGATGQTYATTSNAAQLSLNRLTNDGELLVFKQDNVQEGSVTVSGTTVSYNGAHLSRWSQIQGVDPYDKDQRPEILRGTVMSNLDEMCDWICPESGECQDNEQLNKTKISDVEGDKNVAGVFQSWDDDDDTWVNDYYLAMTGDFVIRIAAGVIVQRGDLLMSAGDGTAKPQADDLVRSCTIAKVTSTTASCTHPDGSYCVPCVLMAC